MEGKALVAFKTVSGSVFHLPEPGAAGPLALCGHYMPFVSGARRGFERTFEDIKNPNVCRHCATEFERRGY